jgi:hypothetical protein
VKGLGQGGGRDGRNIAGINDTHFGGSGGGTKRSPRSDDRTETKQALHEQIGAQKSVRDARFHDVVFDRRVAPQEARGSISVGTEPGKLHDMFDPSVLGRVDEIAQLLFGLRGRRDQEKELIDACQSAIERCGPGEIAVDEFDARKREGFGAGTITNEGANRQASVKKFSRQFEANNARSASDQDHVTFPSAVERGKN